MRAFRKLAIVIAAFGVSLASHANLAMAMGSQAVAGDACQPHWTDRFPGGDLNGTVRAMVMFDDGTGPALFVAGAFKLARGIVVNSVAKWDGENWSGLGEGLHVSADGSSTNGTAYALAVFDDGTGPTLLVGGQFGKAGDVPVTNIAKWNGKTWTALGPGLSGPDSTAKVLALAVFDDGQGPALYAGGGFKFAGELTVNGIAKWNGDWHSLSDGLAGDSAKASSLAVFDDGNGAGLYVGGTFLNAGPNAIPNLAKWDGRQWSSVGGGGTDENVQTVATLIDPSTNTLALFASGWFTEVGAVSANHVAKWDGTAWTQVGTGSNEVLFAMATLDDDSGNGPALYAGSEAGVVKFNGSDWVSLSQGLGGGLPPGAAVFAMLATDLGQGPRLLVGGNFVKANGAPALHIASWDGSEWSPLTSFGGSLSAVEAMVAFDDGSGLALYATGSYLTPDGTVTKGIGKWNGKTWSHLGTGVNARVLGLAVFDDGTGSALYACGFFTIAGGVAANKIAKWDGSSWSPLGSGLSTSNIHRGEALATFDDGSGSALYVGGRFVSAGGISANHIAKWDGKSWSALGGGLGGTSSALAYSLVPFGDESGSALYVGGYFTSAGGIPANDVAKWNGTSWGALGNNFILDGCDASSVKLVTFQDGCTPHLYGAGRFSAAAGAYSISKWDESAWTPIGIVDTGTPVCPQIYALCQFDAGGGPCLYAAGMFTSIGGVPANSIAKWDGQHWSALAGALQENLYGLIGSDARSLCGFDDGTGLSLYVGGFFLVSGPPSAGNFAQYIDCPNTEPIPGDANGDHCVNSSDLLAVINTWGPCQTSPCSADFNGDGVVNHDDLMIVLEHWSDPGL